jgi:ferredoxin
MLKSAAIWGIGEPIMPRVTYFHEITLEDVPEGQKLLDVSIRHRIPHLHQCGGYGRCTTCRVQILDGLSNVSPLGGVEQKVASLRGWDEFTPSRVRLASRAMWSFAVSSTRHRTSLSSTSTK